MTTAAGGEKKKKEGVGVESGISHNGRVLRGRSNGGRKGVLREPDLLPDLLLVALHMDGSVWMSQEVFYTWPLVCRSCQCRGHKKK